MGLEKALTLSFKLVADFCKNIGLIEKYGSGIRRIVEYFAEAKLPSPEFRNISDGFIVTVFALKDVNDPVIVPDVTDNVTDNVTDRLSKIVELIEINNRVSASELGVLLHVSKRTALRDIDKLKEKKILKRVGDEKTGHWKITNKPSQDETN